MTKQIFSSPAFTIIELLIVVAIIGILTSTVTVSLNAFRLKAQATQGLTDIIRIASYIEAYRANYGAYPLSCGTGGSWASFASDYGCDLGACWIGQFSTEGWCPLPRNLNNPPAGQTTTTSTYIYLTDLSGSDYKLIYHVPVSMGVSEEFIDPARPTWAFGVWTPGAAAW